MKALPLVTLATALLLSAAVQAQAPAGHPDADNGSAPSSTGTPAPQQELETHRHDGEVRTEDGRKVNTEDGNAQNDGERDDSAEHSPPGGPTDPASDPGSLE